MSSDQQQSRPRIVIVGAGFAGLFAAKSLRKTDADIVVVDRRNYHLFQPLLYQVATAGLSPSEIAWPIRSILRRQKNTTVLLDAVEEVDVEQRQVVLEDRRLDFDYLVLATGARHSYFGNDDWEPVAPGLKTISDATQIRQRLLLAFERAENSTDEAERRRLLRFVIVGAGPTGVELAGAIAELAHHTLARDFRNIDTRSAQVILVQGADRVLPAFHEDLSRYAQRALEELGVEVRVNSIVTECDDGGVTLGDQRLEAGTILWAAGVASSPAASWLNSAADSTGRTLVNGDLSVQGHPNIFVVGDAAHIEDEDGALVPGVAQAAKQQGAFVARTISARIAGRKSPGIFRYRHLGSLATIGRSAAVAEFSFAKFKGHFAWWLWGLLHIYFLIGVHSPLVVSIRWFWEYLTYRRGARLITVSLAAMRKKR